MKNFEGSLIRSANFIIGIKTDNTTFKLSKLTMFNSISIDLLLHAGEAPAEVGRLTAPMPGKVVSFAVQAGDTVNKGQALAVMDAMKMEHTITAPMDGVVAELLYAPGDQVTEGAELLKLVA